MSSNKAKLFCREGLPNQGKALLWMYIYWAEKALEHYLGAEPYIPRPIPQALFPHASSIDNRQQYAFPPPSPGPPPHSLTHTNPKSPTARSPRPPRTTPLKCLVIDSLDRHALREGGKYSVCYTSRYQFSVVFKSQCLPENRYRKQNYTTPPDPYVSPPNPFLSSLFFSLSSLTP